MDKFAVRIYKAGAVHRLLQRYTVHFPLPERDHSAEIAGCDQVHGSDSEAGAENPIKGRWSAPALDVTKDGEARFFAGEISDGFAQQLSSRHTLAG